MADDPNTKSLSLKIDPELHARLAIVAERDEVPISHWAREALRWALDEDAKPERAEAIPEGVHIPEDIKRAMPRRVGDRIALPERREMSRF